MSNTYVRATGGVTSAQIGSSNDSFDVLPDGVTEDELGDTTSRRAAFRDPRYATTASFRQRVAEAIANSQVVSAPQQPFERVGRFQVTPKVIHDAPPVERELTPHDLEMIAKAEKHGL